ncbi:MAG: fibronectin type III domain-containing protein, partial [Treponema sp.]|nr:fibronectin type III domain-containing protein [Treponema sp.]
MKYVVLTGVLVALLSTCNMLQEPEADKPAGEGNVQVSIQVDQGYPAAERSVFPQVTLDDIDHYALWGALVGSVETELLPSFTTTQGSASVELTEGDWNFTVKGYQEGDALILQGELRNQTISLDSHALNFSLAPLRDGTGSINVTITLPVDSGITTVRVFKDTVEQLPALTVAANQIIYSATNVDTGDYYYSFRLNNSAGNTLAVVSEIVQVRARLSSGKTIALTEANLNALPAAPAAPLIEAGDTQLTVSWTAVAMAGDYEVYYSNTTTPPATPWQTIHNTTTATIRSLTNGTTYYVWIKAKNNAGTSEPSSVVNGTPHAPFVENAITIALAPQTDVSPPSQSTDIVQGESGDFQVTGSYTSYQWYLDGTAISGATTASYTLNTTSMLVGVYELSVVVTTDANDLLSGSCYVNVKEPVGTPAVPSVPEGFVALSGAMVTGSGSSGVFISGRTVTVASFAMAKYETTYELWYEVRVWAEANGYT